MDKILKKGSDIQYLYDFKDGKIQMGMGIGTELDKYMRLKRGELCLFLGHDNVGKTYIINWLFLCHAFINNLTFCIWSGENRKGQILRDMIQMLSGKPFKSLSKSEILFLHNMIENRFDFVDNRHQYKPEELLNIFRESEADVCLIDVVTGMDREIGFESNYKFLNDARHFCNLTNKTLFMNTHPVSASGRAGNLHADGEFRGHLKAPLKNDIEMGKAFLNRCDFLCIIHRYTAHPEMKYYTMLSIEKVKDYSTGGSITPLNQPVLAEFNSGLGMKINGVDALDGHRPDLNKTINKKLFT
jgi:archaellum biogenesis ATPase FlaH